MNRLIMRRKATSRSRIYVGCGTLNGAIKSLRKCRGRWIVIIIVYYNLPQILSSIVHVVNRVRLPNIQLFLVTATSRGRIFERK